MNDLKAGQLWQWRKNELVYLVSVKEVLDAHMNFVVCAWIDLSDGHYFKCSLTVGLSENWKLIADV